MKRKILAIALLLCFTASFSFSGIHASSTAKDTTVTTFASHYYSLYSLSSAPIMLLPIIIMLTIVAFIAFGRNQMNVGFLFVAVMSVLYVLFLVLHCLETRNNSLYTILNEQFEALKIKIKKRDFSISMVPNSFCYLTAALAVLTAFASFPNFRTKNTRYQLMREIEPYLFISPQVILFVTFSLVPILYGIYAAFAKWDLYNDPVFAGLSNFKTILFESKNTYYGQFRNGFGNTFKFVIYVTPFCIIVPFSIALATKYITRGSKVLQAIYYLPSLMSTTTVMLTWKYFFNYTYGMANNLLGSTWNWFAPPYTWVMLVIVTVWWGNGGTMVIYQSALASVPEEQYEAASIDGAGSWQKFRYITLPNMSYPLAYTFVTTIIAQFNVYGQPNLLTGYDYDGANAVLLMYIRDIAFKQQIAGVSSAMALILGLTIMLVSMFQLRMMRGDSQRVRKSKRAGKGGIAYGNR
ncbi:MAG: carbohydrate ABC transporter permease [Christensenellales bacterium]|jgi:multiple sugar transport system permease protein